MARYGVASRRSQVRPSLQKRVVRLSVFLLFLLCAVSVGISASVGWVFTHPVRNAIVGSPAAAGLSYENVEFPSRRGDVTLSGWFLPGRPGGRTVIFAHGYGSNRWGEHPFAPMATVLVQHGFNVLTFDFRAQGRSSGSLITLGQYEQYDVLGAVDYLQRRFGYQVPIGILGCSMGAATALLAAANSRQIRAVVSDSAFADLTAYLSAHMTVWTHLPSFPFTPLILWETPLLTGADPHAVSPIAAVRTLTHTPVLFIQGTADSLIPYDNSKQLYQAMAGRQRDLWLVQRADHVGSVLVAPQAYEQKVLTFFRRYLPSGS